MRPTTMKALLSCVSFRQRAFALFHRTDRLKANSDERRERWNQAIAEHQKPLERRAATSTSSTSGSAGPPPEKTNLPKEAQGRAPQEQAAAGRCTVSGHEGPADLPDCVRAAAP